MKTIDLSGIWECSIPGQSGQIRLPGTLDEGGFGFTEVGMIVLQGLMTFYNFFIVAAAFVAMTPIVRDTAYSLAAKYNAAKAVTCLKYAASVLLMALCMMSIASSSYNPFIYFRF